MRMATFPPVVGSDRKISAASVQISCYGARWWKFCWLGLYAFLQVCLEQKTCFLHPRNYVYWKYLFVLFLWVVLWQGCCWKYWMFQMQCGPEQDQQGALLVLFSPLASACAPLGSMRSCSRWGLTEWQSTLEGENWCVLCFGTGGRGKVCCIAHCIDCSGRWFCVLAVCVSDPVL